MISLSESFETEPEVIDRSALSYIFNEEPVDLSTFIQDQKFMNMPHISLSEPQFTTIQAAERVFYPDIYPKMGEEFNSDYWRTDIPMRNLFTVMYGKGGGKDFVCQVISLRIAYLLMTMKNPQAYFELPDMASIHLLNVASSSGQARRAFFEPMTKVVRNGWFKDKARPKRDSIVYQNNIEAISGHSDAEGQEGLNILLGVADEIDAFPMKMEKGGEREASTSAETILDMLKSSAGTRFPDTFKRVAISYPRYLGSPIMNLIEEGKKSIKEEGDKTIHFVSGPYATWEVNPRISGPDAPSLRDHYAIDPRKARAMYECKPEKAIDPYFKNFDIFRSAIDRPSSPLEITYDVETIESAINPGATMEAWIPKFQFSPDFKPVAGANYAIHADLAVVGDRAGISMSHVEKWKTETRKVMGEDGEVYHKEMNLPIIKNDFTVAFEADLIAKPFAREIQIRWARELAYELMSRGFLIRRYTFDGFQSVDSIQILETHGIETDRVSMDRTDVHWKNLRDVASEGRLRMPYVKILMDEIEALSHINGKIDHPPHLSKDMADALAGSVAGAIVVGGAEDADGSLVDVGDSFFEMGESVTSPLYGYEMYSGGNIMPIGMNGSGTFGL